MTPLHLFAQLVRHGKRVDATEGPFKGIYDNEAHLTRTAKAKGYDVDFYDGPSGPIARFTDVKRARLAAVGEEWRANIDTGNEIRKRARGAAFTAAREGIPEPEIARLLDTSRATVRRWLRLHK